MGDFGPSLALCRMYQRTSKKGATYYAGRMGMASIVLLKTDETSESGQPVWVLKVSEPAPKSDARDLRADRTKRPRPRRSAAMRAPMTMTGCRSDDHQRAGVCHLRPGHMRERSSSPSCRLALAASLT